MNLVKPNFQTILFDLDGTLVDSIRVHLVTLQQLLRERVGVETHKAELHKSIIGIPTRSILAHYVPDEQVDEYMRLWVELEIPHRSELRLFPCIREILSRLYSEGVHTGVVTSQSREEMGAMQSFLGLNGLIQSWTCVDDVCHPKPAPDPVRHALKMLGSRPEESLMVGDTLYDLESGRGAGCKVGAALWGSGDHTELIDYQPDFIFYNPSEILAAAGISGDKEN